MKVFLSYEFPERKLAGSIKEILGNFGLECFLAHEDILPSKEWETEILSFLRSCDVFAPILTKNFHASVWTNQEIGHAISDAKHIVSLKVDRDPPGFLARYQALVMKRENGFPLEEFIKNLNDSPKTESTFKKFVIHTFCNSQNFTQTHMVGDWLSSLKGITEKDFFNALNASITNEQIGLAFKAKSIIKGFVAANSEFSIPYSLKRKINLYYKASVI